MHKGPDLLSVADDAGGDALPARMARALEKAGRGDEAREIHPVHRLDRPVSGLLLFARSRAVRDQLQAGFAEGRIRREYLAVVEGRVRDPLALIDRPLRLRGRGATGAARTHYECLRLGEDCSLLRLRIETGRRHQIRQHLAGIGHPILGDREYKGPERDGFNRRRLALHASDLWFRHPLDGRELHFHDPAPARFEQVFAAGSRKAGTDIEADTDKARRRRRGKSAAAGRDNGKGGKPPPGRRTAKRRP